MAFSESLAARIGQYLARRKSVEEKKMFGGVGFLLHGNMLVGVWKDSLIARLGPTRATWPCGSRMSRSSTSRVGP
jgi:TfoX/Sxy family transcriptional regulator of competence genes